jgi:hypothetical protein
MTQLEADQRDARRYRMLRELVCADEQRQEEIADLIEPLMVETNGRLTPQLVDRAMDLVLNTLKLV